MIKTTALLKEEYRSYANIGAKIKRMCDEQELYPLIKGRGIYETDPHIPGYLLAMIICGPSYLSFDYALDYYGLIPESVNVFTSATFCKKKKKILTNHFGTYLYRDVPDSVFSLEVQAHSEKGYVYMMASPEKSICDKLYTISPCANRKEMERLLFEDLRMDYDEFCHLNLDTLAQLTDHYHTKNHKLLHSYIRGYLK